MGRLTITWTVDVRIYCEHGAVTFEIRRLTSERCVEVVHFPYDDHSRSRRIPRRSSPSAAQIQDLNLPIKELPGTVGDYSGSARLAEILLIVGDSNRRDALHIDSAFKSGCSAFITPDRRHILNLAVRLEALLGIKFFHPIDGLKDFERFINS